MRRRSAIWMASRRSAAAPMSSPTGSRACCIAFTPSGKFEQLIDFAQGSADLTYIPATKTAIIPLMLENKIVAYKLD